MTDQFETMFGDMKSLLGADTKVDPVEFTALLKKARDMDRERYEREWLPHLSQATLPEFDLDDLSVFEQVFELLPQTQRFVGWTTTRHQFRIGDEVPQDLHDPMNVAVSRMVSDYEKEDFEESLEEYGDEYAEDFGGAPYQNAADYTKDHMLHGFTFYLLNYGNLNLTVVEINAGSLGRLISVYGGNGGFVVQGDELLAFNDQGSLGQITEPKIPGLDAALRLTIYG